MSDGVTITLEQAMTMLAEAQDHLIVIQDDLDDCQAENDQLRDACNAMTRELGRLREQRDQLRTGRPIAHTEPEHR